MFHHFRTRIRRALALALAPMLLTSFATEGIDGVAMVTGTWIAGIVLGLGAILLGIAAYRRTRNKDR